MFWLGTANAKYVFEIFLSWLCETWIAKGVGICNLTIFLVIPLLTIYLSKKSDEEKELEIKQKIKSQKHAQLKQQELEKKYQPVAADAS